MSESFIHQQYLSDISICDDLIDFFKKSEDKTPGVVGNGSIKKEIKDSLDLRFNQIDQVLFTRYLDLLFQVVDGYVSKFPACISNVPWNNILGQVQYYPPGGGFKEFHSERGGKGNSWTRHLVFMTYLNDVTDQGGTEFLHQKLVVQPRKGLTLIWPPDWTHTHRGVISPTEEKYIATGWLCFNEPEFWPK